MEKSLFSKRNNHQENNHIKIEKKKWNKIYSPDCPHTPRPGWNKPNSSILLAFGLLANRQHSLNLFNNFIDFDSDDFQILIDFLLMSLVDFG